MDNIRLAMSVKGEKNHCDGVQCYHNVCLTSMTERLIQVTISSQKFRGAITKSVLHGFAPTIEIAAPSESPAAFRQSSPGGRAISRSSHGAISIAGRRQKRAAHPSTNTQ